MAYTAITPLVTASGSLNGAAASIDLTNMTIGTVTFSDGGLANILLTLTPDKTSWDDYSTGGQLTYTFTITNNEPLPFAAPISVQLSGFDPNTVSYVDASITNPDAGTIDFSAGNLTFTIGADIAASAGTFTTPIVFAKPVA